MARIAVGSLFFLSGRAKLFVRERREQMEQILIEAHIPFPKFNAVFVSRWSLFAGYCSPLGQWLSSRGTLSGDSYLAFFLRAWMAECWSPVSVANTSL